MMPFGLKNARATYMRATTTIFHDIIHKEIEVYVDDVIIKSKKSTDHTADLRKFFDRLQRYNLKLNPANCPFGVPAGKLLGFIVSRRGIELDPSKVKAIQDLPPPKNKKDVMSFLGRLNYISRFIAQSTVICEPIFKMLRKEVGLKNARKPSIKSRSICPNHPFWSHQNQEGHCYFIFLCWTEPSVAFWDNMMKLSEVETLFQCIHHIPHIKDGSTEIYLSEAHAYGKSRRRKIQTIKTYFPDEDVSFVAEDITETYDSWRMFFDGAANFKGVGIGVVWVLETGQHYSVSTKFRFPCTNNMSEYEACILGLRLAIDMNVQELLVIGDSDLLVHQVLGEWAIKNTKILPYLHCVQELIKRFTKIEFKHVLRVQNEFADALATLSFMIQHPDKNFIDPFPIGIHKQPAYCAHVEEESDGNPWFYDIKEYLAKGRISRARHPYSEAHTSKISQPRLSKRRNSV
ncbi:uncharacterized protein [Nicotiana tomentosiformis]|uniref:uncharacterized protein n=1 Tax=Nicotiana tomentosiformis TaxID=4098 RepID=UPI00388C9ABE